VRSIDRVGSNELDFGTAKPSWLRPGKKISYKH
jgi:hypothetical protein